MSCIVRDHTQVTTAQNAQTNTQTNKQWQKKSTTRKITLREFKPESYKVWEMSTKATLKYNKLFDIVDGTETDPTPLDDDGTSFVQSQLQQENKSKNGNTITSAHEKQSFAAFLTPNYSS